MEGDILFQLDLGYLTTQYPSLNNLSPHKYYNKDVGKFVWVFNLKDIEKVIEILGKPITFEHQEINISKLIGLCPPLKEKIGVDRWKGKGEYRFVEETNIFLVGEWQKNPTTGKPEQAWISIPKENVVVNWEIIKNYQKGVWIKIRTQAEHVCRRLGFDGVFRDSGTFDWSKFTGLHRKGHLPYVYYPVKVLAHLGVIEYSKMGKLRRIKDHLELQHEFTKPIPMEDIIKKKEE